MSEDTRSQLKRALNSASESSDEHLANSNFKKHKASSDTTSVIEHSSLDNVYTGGLMHVVASIRKERIGHQLKGFEDDDQFILCIDDNDDEPDAKQSASSNGQNVIR